MLAQGVGCGSSQSDCPVDSCLSLTLIVPPERTLSTIEVMVRDGDQLVRRLVVGSDAASGGALKISVPNGQPPMVRRAVYVRAYAEDASGRSELVGLAEGTRASLSQAVVSLALGCAVAPCASPGARRGAAMTFVPQTHNVLLHGGKSGSGALLDDLWAWNGLWWQKLSTSLGPSARSQHGLVYDSASGQVLLFGGQGASSVLGDSWLLDTVALSWQRVATVSPSARRLAAMGAAPVGTGRGVILFGGQDGTGASLGETWLWDGHAWQQGSSSLCPVTPIGSSRLPRCRMGAALVSRPSERETLLIGGWLGPQPATAFEFDEVIWRFDGTDWSIAPLYRPPFVLSRFQHVAASLQSSTGTRGVWVGLGDSAVGLRQDSYLLDESTAQFRPILGLPPSPRAESASAYDAEREEVVIFGGRDDRGLFGDTLTFSVETGYQAHLR